MKRLKKERIRGTQKKRWEDNIREWTGLRNLTESSCRQDQMAKNCQDCIIGAATTNWFRWVVGWLLGR